MSFLIHLTMALLSLCAIVLSCILFTNAIEFAGNKLKLGNNATGSILAVLGTGLPETVVPLVAVFSGVFSGVKIDVAKEIAQGAILGSPFMLLTLAMLFLGVILIIKKRDALYVDYKIVLRDYKYLFGAYTVAFLFSFKFLNEYRFIASFLLIFLYGIFVYRTIVKSRTTCIECECDELYLIGKIKAGENFVLFFQLFFSLLILIFSSHIFVSEIEYFSEILRVPPAILALFVTPFATELPECINSIIWLRANKDDLAVANVLGAVVFQTTILFAAGIILTPWVLSRALFINCIFAILAALIFVFGALKTKKIKPLYFLFCGLIYVIYFVFILN